MLNRALQANKSRVDHLITRLVMTQIPQLEPERGRQRTVDEVNTL